MHHSLKGISSMATRQVLAELADAYRQRGDGVVAFESVGGVDAAKRVRSGESFDLVVLAEDAIESLEQVGGVVPGSKVGFVHSAVAIAVRAGAAHPDIGSADALRQALLDARTVGYSTGPSGVALSRLFERWGIAETLRDRIVQAPPGVPVGVLVAKGEVELGFQQLSELMHLDGIEVLGPMPEGLQIVTTFSAGLCSASSQPEAVRAFITFMTSREADAAKRRHGMEPA